jgi:predicted DsbA family dithiol-disulfide isomerase
MGSCSGLLGFLLYVPMFVRPLTQASPAAPLAAMKVTYYLDVLSSWCTWVEPTWAELKRRFAGRAEFEWRIALMNPEDFPVSRAQCDWFYRRSGGTVLHSPFMLNSEWLEESRRGHYEAPNYVAEAAREFGFDGDEIRLALARAALREGKKVGDLATAVAIASEAGAGRLDRGKLQAAAASDAVKARVAASTKEFFAHQINQRPSFILTDAIGDKAVFSGLVRIEPLAATIDAMLADTAAYTAHEIHHGKVPSA